MMFLDDFTAIDLTHPLSSEVPTWDGSCGFCVDIKKDYDQTFRVQQLNMQAGIGTHMDAPSHVIQGASSIADIPLNQLILPTCLINVSKQATADYQISLDDVMSYESTHGIIPAGSLVIAYTGWSRFWLNPIAYRNADKNGCLHFPCFSVKAIVLLLKRDIAGIAIDTLSPDCSDASFPVHQLILGAGKYIIENVADCSNIPPKGGYTIALPLRIQEGTESPIRMIGLIPKTLMDTIV